MPQPGYTDAQAARLKHRLDVAMAKVEDDVAALGAIVNDTTQSSYFGVLELEELRGQVEVLKAVVDRRTRKVVA